MLQALASHWWVFLVRGVAAVLVGLLMWFRPEASLALLVMFLGAWMLVDGIFTSIASVVGREKNSEWGWLLMSGILSLLLGVLILRAPGITIVLLMLYVAAWAFMLGISQIALGWRLRKELSNEWMLYLGGAVALLFGISILWDPGAGAIGALWMIALFSLLFGVSLIVLAFRLKGLVGKKKADR